MQIRTFMASETTIRHPSTPDALAAYIASAGRTVTTRRLEQYAALMHFQSVGAVEWAIRRLVKQGRIVRVRRGVYRGTGG